MIYKYGEQAIKDSLNALKIENRFLSSVAKSTDLDF